jgi:hypothetical protein
MYVDDQGVLTSKMRREQKTNGSASISAIISRFAQSFPWGFTNPKPPADYL